MRRHLPLALVVVVAASVSAEPRVILVSWDGAGHVMTSRLLEEGRLPNLKRLIDGGAWSDGMVSSFPTKTAAAHAILFTGYYGHRSGITGNDQLKLPASAHDRLDTMSGYFSTALTVDALWTRAARAGLDTFVFHATQAYPFERSRTGLDEAARRRLHLVHGYTGVQLRGEVIDSARAGLEVPEGWAIPEARGPEARAFRFRVGDTELWGLFFDDPLDAAVGWDTLGIVRRLDATAFDARVSSGEGAFSTPIEVSTSGVSVWFSLRLFEADRDANRFLLYRSGAVELARSNPDTPLSDLPVMEVYAGNSGSRAYAKGDFGPTRPDGGDGAAEARFHETLVHVQQQIVRQSRVALDAAYSLVVLYSPVTDDVAHELAGYLDPTLDGFDDAVSAAHWESIARGFELQDRWLGEILDVAARDGAHVMVVSDHGMASTDRLVHLNLVLEQAGLLARGPDGRVDLSRTRALALADTSIAANTVDRKGGIVPPEERAATLRDAREALTSFHDPETGQPVVTAAFEAATDGLLQPGGASTGDLFLDFAPHYYPSAATTASAPIERTDPRGQHIFVPTRREMLAICAAFGPRVPRGVQWGKVRAIDIAPTVLDLLDLEVPDDMPGRSLVPARTLLTAH